MCYHRAMRRWRLWVADWLVVTLAWGLLVLMLSALLTGDVYLATDFTSQVRAHIRNTEFDFIGWTFAAAAEKLGQASLNQPAYAAETTRSAYVLDFFGLRRQIEQLEGQIANRYADPAVTDPAAATAGERAQAAALRVRLRATQPAAEAILEEQLSAVLAEQGLAAGGQPIPPVAFHLTPLPYALIVSPRTVIRQDANLDVSGDLTLDEQVALETEVAEALDVSALVVPLGGIGTYPTMVAQSSDLNWIASVVAHEWIHNYLTLRPLGASYTFSGQLRTMNETTAEMIGNELGELLIERYYPTLARPPSPYPYVLQRDQAPVAAPPPSFSFQAEMHATRVTADRLLAEGKVAAAEAYMEARRRFLWDHGYQLRRLNQAYFAFYGAYAAGGPGAGGADPVGEAVRLLRRRSATIADFVNTMAWFTGPADLFRYLNLPLP
ncbi:MAG: hypothetical protein IT317_20050 [Anaerolineales bacterium]|nr:hypothetical protein [Anaerolineales bacterium]